jgi:thiol:disulfide interchange protein DsbA
MNRREFSLPLAGAAGLAATGLWTLPAQAQASKPVDGEQYHDVTPPAPVSAPKGLVEVIEFFWYGCPHCNAFEPAIEPWIARQPKDKVLVHRVHVAFGARQQVHQRLWAALDSMGVPDSIHGKVFKRFHDEHQPIESADEAIAWATSVGLDPVKFRGAWFAFDMPARLRKASELAQAYQIDGVPTIGIQGRWRTAPSDAGQGHEGALRVADYLIDLARKGA